MQKTERPPLTATKTMFAIVATLATWAGTTVSAPAQTQNRAAGSSTQSPAASLPGGASSLQETYQDWQVACQISDNQKRCAVSQQQVQQNGQRVIGVELQQGNDGKLTGSLILPFGLLFENGVTLAIDDKPTGQPLRFRTCLPGGCLVPLAVDPAMLTNLRAGTSLELQATSADGPAIPFTLSLKGFAAAIDRLKVLLAS